MKMKVRRKPGFLLTGRQVIKYVAIHGLTSWLMTHSRPSWATPSIEFAIMPPAVGRRAPKQLKAFGVGSITGELRQLPHT